MKLFKINSCVQSIDPPETAFNYSYWSSQICPFKPESCLIVGAGESTILYLIKDIWKVKDNIFTIIDIKVPESVPIYCKMIIGDAKEEIKNLKDKFDYVIVDIANGSAIPNFVFSEEFVRDLAKITKKLLSINYLDMLEDIETRAKKMEHYKNYFDFDFLKDLLHNHIYFFKAKDNKESYFL